MVDTKGMEAQLAILLKKKKENEQKLPMDILTTRFAKSYGKLCSDIADTQARLEATKLYNEFHGIRLEDDARWADLVNRIDLAAKGKTPEIQQYYLDVAALLEKEAKAYKAA